jgi:hypothetical protein
MLGDLTAPPLPEGTVDDYATCAATYVTLRVYHRSADPKHVGEMLELVPTGTQLAGDQYLHRQASRTKRYEISGWFLRVGRAQVNDLKENTHAGVAFTDGNCSR